MERLPQPQLEAETGARNQGSKTKTGAVHSGPKKKEKKSKLPPDGYCWRCITVRVGGGRVEQCVRGTACRLLGRSSPAGNSQGIPQREQQHGASSTRCFAGQKPKSYLPKSYSTQKLLHWQP